MAGHCHGVVATTTTSDRSYLRKTLLRSTTLRAAPRGPRYGGTSVVRSMTSMAPASPTCRRHRPESCIVHVSKPQFTKPAHIARLLDERHAVPVVPGCAASACSRLIAGIQGLFEHRTRCCFRPRLAFAFEDVDSIQRYVPAQSCRRAHELEAPRGQHVVGVARVRVEELQRSRSPIE